MHSGHSGASSPDRFSTDILQFYNNKHYDAELIQHNCTSGDKWDMGSRSFNDNIIRYRENLKERFQPPNTTLLPKT
jgi:hypothetical protein